MADEVMKKYTIAFAFRVSHPSPLRFITEAGKDPAIGDEQIRESYMIRFLTNGTKGEEASS